MTHLQTASACRQLLFLSKSLKFALFTKPCLVAVPSSLHHTQSRVWALFESFLYVNITCFLCVSPLLESYTHHPAFHFGDKQAGRRQHWLGQAQGYLSVRKVQTPLRSIGMTGRAAPDVVADVPAGPSVAPAWASGIALLCSEVLPTLLAAFWVWGPAPPCEVALPL